MELEDDTQRRSIVEHITTDTGAGQNAHFVANFYRQIASRAAQASAKAVNTATWLSLQEIETDKSVDLLSFSTDHSGDAPIKIDVDAHEAGWEVCQRELRAFLPAERQILDVGEESGTPTKQLVPGTIICRQDPLDGSTNARVMFANWGSVVLIDEVRHDGRNGLRGRHCAGSIAMSTGWTVSWLNDSRYDHNRHRYNNLRGQVFIEGNAWGFPETQLHDTRWDRLKGTVAAVASKPERYLATLEALGGTQPSQLYNVAGTPLVLGLLVGDIERVVEATPVTLHDSALLLPHQLLGGRITDLDGGALDYLKLYEAHSLNLNPKNKPVPGYMAWAGVTDDSDDAAA